MHEHRPSVVVVWSEFVGVREGGELQRGSRRKEWLIGKHSLHLVDWRRHTHRGTKRDAGGDGGTHRIGRHSMTIEGGEEYVGRYLGGKSKVLVACERDLKNSFQKRTY